MPCETISHYPPVAYKIIEKMYGRTTVRPYKIKFMNKF